MKKLLLLLIFLCSFRSVFAYYDSVMCVGGTYPYFPTVTYPGTISFYSSDTTVASVDHNSGVLHAIASGSVVISVSDSFGVVVLAFPVTIQPSAVADSITAYSSVCVGSAISLEIHPFGDTGGIWASSNTAIATVQQCPGITTYALGLAWGVASGSTSFTYTISDSVGGCPVTHVYQKTVSVVAPPILSPIYASSPVMCPGGTVSLTDTLGGGSWHSSDTAIIHLGGTTYWSTVAETMLPGTVTITYVYTGWCASTYIVDSESATYTVGSAPDAGTISGPTSICSDPATYTSSVPGGLWTCSGSMFIDGITGLATTTPGTANVYYSVSNSCGSDTASLAVVIDAPVAVGAITGATTVSEGGTIALSNAIVGGTWSVSSISVATIDPVTGVLSGVSAGSVTVTYTLSGCYSPSSVTYDVTVVPADVISGSVYFAPTTYTGNIRVWLIAYSAPMLTAIDSVDIYSPGSSAAYQFLNEPAGTYRIKAAPLDGPLTGTGFIPTYFTSSLYWNTADVVTHATGTVNSGNNINLMTGTITSGPGFIGGDVTTGANKGTSTGMPVDGLMMYLLDATNTLYQSTRTDAAGHYSFSNIPSGTYYVFPDSLNYATTPYTGIVITSGSPTYSAASFIQHTLSKTITPIPVGINTVTSTNTSVVVFPNPTTGKVNIAWQVPSAQTADITITDVTGRVVMTNTLNMSTGAGSSYLNLNGLVSALYTISVKSADINYTTRIQLQ